MTEPTPLTYVLNDLFPKAGPQLLRLLAAAAENASLLRGDYFTMRDWLEISGDEGEESAVVLLLVMMLSLEEGSLCVTASAESIAGRLSDLVGADEALAWAQRVLDDVARDGFPRLIGAAPGDHRPVIRHAIGERDYFYFQKYLQAERQVYEQFQQRLQKLVPAEPPANLAAVLHEVLVERPLVAGGRTLQLDGAQRLAVGTALLPAALARSCPGGPGTGKTSIDAADRCCCAVWCGAAISPNASPLPRPTGRAARARLGDAFCVPGARSGRRREGRRLARSLPKRAERQHAAPTALLSAVAQPLRPARREPNPSRRGDRRRGVDGRPGADVAASAGTRRWRQADSAGRQGSASLGRGRGGAGQPGPGRSAPRDSVPSSPVNSRRVFPLSRSP